MTNINWIIKNKDYLLNILDNDFPTQVNYISNYIANELYPNIPVSKIDTSSTKNDINRSSSFNSSEKMKLGTLLDKLFPSNGNGYKDENEKILLKFYKENRSAYDKLYDSVVKSMEQKGGISYYSPFGPALVRPRFNRVIYDDMSRADSSRYPYTRKVHPLLNKSYFLPLSTPIVGSYGNPYRNPYRMVYNWKTGVNADYIKKIFNVDDLHQHIELLLGIHETLVNKMIDKGIDAKALGLDAGEETVYTKDKIKELKELIEKHKKLNKKIMEKLSTEMISKKEHMSDKLKRLMLQYNLYNRRERAVASTLKNRYERLKNIIDEISL